MGKEEKYRALIREQKESNLHVKDFCYNHGIAYSTFYYWLKKIKRNDQEERPLKFVPLMVKDHPGTFASAGGLNQKQTRLNEEPEVNFELVYPNGVVLRMKSGLNLASLRSLIQLQG